MHNGICQGMSWQHPHQPCVAGQVSYCWKAFLGALRVEPRSHIYGRAFVGHVLASVSLMHSRMNIFTQELAVHVFVRMASIALSCHESSWQNIPLLWGQVWPTFPHHFKCWYGLLFARTTLHLTDISSREGIKNQGILMMWFTSQRHSARWCAQPRLA